MSGKAFETMEDYYSQLPEEIIEKIATEHLDTSSELISLAGVCTSWRSTLFELYNSRRRLLHHVIPGILKSRTSGVVEQQYCSITTRHRFRPIPAIFIGIDPVRSPPGRTRTSTIHLPFKTLEERENVYLKKCHCVASRDGWLVLAHPISSYDQFQIYPLTIYLLNPATGASILLPPLLPDQFEFGDLGDGSYWTLLSSSPDDEDCHIIIVADLEDGQNVAWCKVRGGRWKFTSRIFDDEILCATYFGGKLYVLDGKYYVHVFSNLINTTSSEEKSVAAPTVRLFHLDEGLDENYRLYSLLELNGELVVILSRCFSNYDDVVAKLSKLVLLSNSDHRWEEVESLDGYAVFLGTHQSLCVPVNDNANNKKKMMVKSNHIYYLMRSCGHCDFGHKQPAEHGPQYFYRCTYSIKLRKFVELSQSTRDKDYDNMWFSPMLWDIGKQLKKRRRKDPE